MKKIIAIVIIAGIAISAGLFLKSQKKEIANLAVAKEYTYRVSTHKALTKEVVETRHFLAQLLANKSALIASKFSAEIKKIYVRENDIVTKGDLLVLMDDADIRADIASLKEQRNALEEDMKNVKRSLDRSLKLYKIEAISQEKLDNTQVLYMNKVAALQSTEQKIKQLYAHLKYLNIKAPFDGRIGGILVDAGNLATPGKPILSLNSNDQKLLFSYASTGMTIIEGQKVIVDNQDVGSIVRLYDDAKNALLVAEIKLDKSIDYMNKAFVNIDVVVAKDKGCAVPLNALLHRKNETLLMLYKENRFEPYPVDIILQNEDEALLKECPDGKFATASEAKLAILPTLGKISLVKE